MSMQGLMERQQHGRLDLMAQVRKGEFAAAVESAAVAYGPFPVLYAKNGYVLGTGSLIQRPELMFVAGGRAVPAAQAWIDEIPDPICAEAGLAVYRVRMEEEQLMQADVFAEEKGLEDALIFFRLGLSLHVMDKSQAHLQNRESDNLPTIQQPAVKMSYSEFLIHFHTVLSQYREGAVEGEGAELSFYPHLHRHIDQGMRHLLTLMGGHGYLRTGILHVGYLSDLILNLYGSEGYPS